MQSRPELCWTVTSPLLSLARHSSTWLIAFLGWTILSLNSWVLLPLLFGTAPRAKRPAPKWVGGRVGHILDIVPNPFLIIVLCTVYATLVIYHDGGNKWKARQVGSYCVMIFCPVLS